MLSPSQRKPARLRPLLLLPVLLLAYWLIYVIVVATPLPPDPGGLYRTAPPPEVAIELTPAQESALAHAYAHGIDPGDPGDGGDSSCERLRLLPYKKLRTWRRQFQRRGFTVAKIKTMLRTGVRSPHTHPTKGTTYTKISDPAGNWIIVDFVDCLIWQVAPYNFK
jgi:hypothetical protein